MYTHSIYIYVCLPLGLDFAIGLGLCHFLPRDFEPLKAFLDLFEACCGSINIIPWKPTSDPDRWDEAWNSATKSNAMFNIDNDNDHHSHRLNMALIMIMIMIINVIFQYISIYSNIFQFCDDQCHFQSRDHHSMIWNWLQRRAEIWQCHATPRCNLRCWGSLPPDACRKRRKGNTGDHRCINLWDGLGWLILCGKSLLDPIYIGGMESWKYLWSSKSKCYTHDVCG